MARSLNPNKTPNSKGRIVWSALDFDRHAGKTLPQVLFSDPDWFFWAYPSGAFNRYPSLKKEAEKIHAKARAIKVPQRGAEKMVAEYTIHKPTHRFNGLDLVPESRPRHERNNKTLTCSVIDMSVVRQISKYDKQGYKRFVRDLKHLLFGDSQMRMTKRRCEDFFSDHANFDLVIHPAIPTTVQLTMFDPPTFVVNLKATSLRIYIPPTDPGWAPATVPAPHIHL